MRNISRMCAPLVLIVLLGAGCSSAGAANGPAVAVIVEGGQPLRDRDVAALEALAARTLTAGGSFEVSVVSGPNSDVLRPLELPGITVEGRLETAARNSVALERDLDGRLPAVITAIGEAAERPVEDGRDLLGAVSRAGDGDHDRLVVVFTSGGIHRTNEVDFLVEIPPPSPWGLRSALVVELWGVGDVPVPDGTPSRELTSALIEHWTGACGLHGANCEVMR